MSERILIINPFGIGDVLFTTPLVRAIRGAFPGSYVGYLCNRRTAPMLRQNPDVDQVLVYERDDLVWLWKASPLQFFVRALVMFSRVRRKRFSLVLDLSLGERYSFILAMAGARQRIGFDYRRRGRFLTHRMPIEGYHGSHVVEHGRRLLRYCGIRVLDDHLVLRIAPEDAAWADRWLRDQGLVDGRRLVGVVPAGGVSWGIAAPYRRWTLEGFASVGDRLARSHNARVLLFGEPSDRPVCRDVAAAMQIPPLDVSGQTTLEQFIALLSRLDLVVCNDGGPVHLAVSQRVPTVAVFGPVDPTVYGPYPSDTPHRTIFRDDLPCRPCYHRFRLPPCPYERVCLTGVSADDVVAACEELLAVQK